MNSTMAGENVSFVNDDPQPPIFNVSLLSFQ